MGEAGKTYKEAMLFSNALRFATDKVCENKYIAARCGRYWVFARRINSFTIWLNLHLLMRAAQLTL